MEITEDIIKAILKYCSDNDCTVEAFAEKVGVSHAAVSQWTGKKTKSIRNVNWVKLFPLIEPYCKLSKNGQKVDYPIKNGNHSQQAIGGVIVNHGGYSAQKEIIEYLQKIENLTHDLRILLEKGNNA